MFSLLVRRLIPNSADCHDPEVRRRCGMLSGLVGIALNLLLCAGKFLAGLLSGSIAITADAFNNLSDGLSCLISIVGFKVSGKEPDAKHPFGYGRTEYIAGLIVSFIIILVGFEFFKTSLDRILHPAAVAFSAVLMGILAVSMLVKLWMGAFNVNIGRRIDSPVLMAAGQDSRNDVITTAVVVLGMVAGRFTTLPVDGYVGVAVAAFILWSGIGIAKDTVAPLLGEAADPEVAHNIRRIVMESDHIVGVHDMIIHNYGAGRSIASLHAAITQEITEVPSDSDFVAVHEEIDEAEKRVWQQTGVYLVIHMDPIDINNAYVNALREQTDGVLRQIDGQLTMHDFRVVDGKRQINLIFDVVVPFSYDEDAKRDLLMKIYDGLKAIDSRYNPVVTLDHQM